MSIEIEANFINKASVDGRYQIDRDKFSHVSLQVKKLLELQISCLREKEKLVFFIEDNKILVTYDDENNEQDDLDSNNIEQAIINSLEKTIKKLPNKNAKIVVYCSLGIRSEIVADKLIKQGYTNVYNLYGGIFEWKNNNYNVIDTLGNTTEKVHTFNKDWSKWLFKGEKVY